MTLQKLIRIAVPVLLTIALNAAAREIVVGEVVDYAGEYGEASRDYVAGAKVFFDALNARGGLNGTRIRLLVLDGGRDAQSVRARTRELLDTRQADVLFGYVGDAALAAACLEPELASGEVALVAPLAGGDAPAAAARAVFFTRPDRRSEVAQVISHFRALQVTRFAELGAADLADVAAVRSRGAQALIVDADTATVAQFVKRYKPLDPGAMIVTLSTVNHRVMYEALGPKLAHGVMITQVVPNPLLPDSLLQKEHLDAIRTFRDEPPSHLTLEGFVAAKVLVEGLRRAGAHPGRGAILKALQGLGRLDLNGMRVDLRPGGRASSAYVDLAMIRRDGSLLQ